MKNICKNCKYFRETISNDVIFIEQVELCDKFNEQWPCKDQCKHFEIFDLSFKRKIEK